MMENFYVRENDGKFLCQRKLWKVRESTEIILSHRKYWKISMSEKVLKNVYVGESTEKILSKKLLPFALKSRITFLWVAALAPLPNNLTLFSLKNWTKKASSNLYPLVVRDPWIEVTTMHSTISSPHSPITRNDKHI